MLNTVSLLKRCQCNFDHRHAPVLIAGNLLVDAHLCVKVADFGLSRIKQDLHHPLTGGLGTYQWMAPEVISHTRYTESADVYSFGIVLWECAARQVPYPGTGGFHAAVGVMTRYRAPHMLQV